MTTKPKHKIFTSLVRGEKDVAGMVAYAIYKSKKLEFIKKKTKELGDENRAIDSVSEFVEINGMKGQVDTHKEQANIILNEYGNLLLQKKLDEIEQYYREKRLNHFLWGVMQSVVGSILFTLLIGILVIFLWSLQIGTEEVFEQIFNIEITKKSGYK